jgi:hypothetical protein
MQRGQFLEPNKSTLLLSLRILPFVVRQDVKDSTHDNNHANNWIEITESNPYAAFVVSLGSPDMTGHERFVPELQVLKTCDRID